MKNSLTALLRKNITGHLSPYQQNVPNMETDAVKNTTDTVNPDCCTDIDVTDTANNKSPVSLKKDSAAEVSQKDASSQTTNSES